MNLFGIMDFCLAFTRFNVGQQVPSLILSIMSDYCYMRGKNNGLLWLPTLYQTTTNILGKGGTTCMA